MSGGQKRVAVDLADRVASSRASSNELDVLCEIALFEPDDEWTAVRANAAGTKVIYTGRDGDRTCWAYDWTKEPRKTVELLRHRARAVEAGR